MIGKCILTMQKYPLAFMSLVIAEIKSETAASAHLDQKVFLVNGNLHSAPQLKSPELHRSQSTKSPQACSHAGTVAATSNRALNRSEVLQSVARYATRLLG